MRVLRCITLNLWGAQPPLAQRMALVAEGIRSLAPDVVALQEVQDIPEVVANQAEALWRETGMGFVFAPATPFRGGFEGLALLSRHPIVSHESRELPHATPGERRVVLSARLLAAGTSIWVHTTHLN